MKRNLINFCIVATFFAIATISCNTPIVTPDPPIHDTIPDTIIVPTIDTISIDTLTKDTTIDVENNKVVVGYVSHGGSKLPDPFLCTHICYAFAELYVVNNVYQKMELKSPEAKFLKVLALRDQNPDLKIQLSINHTVGNPGNSQGGGFSAMAKDSAQRKHFAQDCLAFCQKYNLDGIDIDWELPGLSWSGHACDPSCDYKNYILLMRDLRETLGNDLLLTAAAYVKAKKEATEGGYKYMDAMDYEPYVDWLNLMCYDMCSAPNPHNAIKCGGYWDIERTWRSYYSVGYPMDKLVLGLPFYGRHIDGDGEWYYWKMLGLAKQSPTVWQSEIWSDYWQVPYAKKNGQFWCSYDNPRSIAIKGNYVDEKGMRGLMYWEASGDTDKHDLNRAMWNAMKTKTLHYVKYIYHLSDGTVSATDWMEVEAQN